MVAITQSDEDLIAATAEALDDPRLAGLFVTAQFRTLPPDWCRDHYKRPYPPVPVVFGEGSMERYRRYVDAGRDS